MIWVVKQRFVVMSSLNVNSNLQKIVYTKLEKYSAEIDDVCSRLTLVFIRLSAIESAI